MESLFILKESVRMCGFLEVSQKQTHSKYDIVWKKWTFKFPKSSAHNLNNS